MAEPFVLLTSICKPFLNTHEPHSIMAELFQASVTRAQGIWSPRVINHQWGLDVIAQNILAPTVVLHYPSEEDLVRELRRYRFNVVGISFNICTFPEMLRTAALVRKHAPKATLVLGGYGTALPEEVLRPHADLLCQGDGIPFMRDLLGETPQPYVAPIITHTTRLLSMRVSEGGVICAGLGCPRGCDFCMTSHFYQQRHVKFIETGRQLFEAIQRTRRVHPNILDFSIIDEDFLVDELRAYQFRDQVRSSMLPVSISIFASASSLSRFSPMDLAEMGVDGVWMGFEAPGADLPKMAGLNVPALVADLRSHGITVLLSAMLGFDYHTEEIIWQEVDQLLALEPVMTQFLVRGPALCTPLHREMEAQGRLLPWARDAKAMDHKRADGFSLAFQHPHLSESDMERIQLACYDEEYRRLGPSPVRALEVWFQGYKRFKNSHRPILKAKADKFAREVRKGLPLLSLAARTVPSQDNRRRVEAFREEVIQEFGLGPEDQAKELMVPLMARWTDFLLDRNLWQAPPLLRRTWRLKEKQGLLSRLTDPLDRLKGLIPRPVGD